MNDEAIGTEDIQIQALGRAFQAAQLQVEADRLYSLVELAPCDTHVRHALVGNRMGLVASEANALVAYTQDPTPNLEARTPRPEWLLDQLDQLQAKIDQVRSIVAAQIETDREGGLLS